MFDYISEQNYSLEQILVKDNNDARILIRRDFNRTLKRILRHYKRN